MFRFTVYFHISAGSCVLVLRNVSSCESQDQVPLDSRLVRNEQCVEGELSSQTGNRDTACNGTLKTTKELKNKIVK